MRASILLLLAACGVNETPQPEAPPELPSCVPNRDGVLTADELPIAFDATASYYVSTGGTFTVDLEGPVWDLSEERAPDQVIALGPQRLGGQWYAGNYPQGQFVIDAGDGLEGIYHQDDQALWLDGTASREMSPAGGRTLVIYDRPLAVLRFPLKDGDTFVSSAQHMGSTIAGLPFQGADEVTVSVTGDGRVDVPYVRFSPAFLVDTRVRRTSAGPEATRRSYIFLFECFGEVARADSRPNSNDLVYLRRFALGVTP